MLIPLRRDGSKDLGPLSLSGRAGGDWDKRAGSGNCSEGFAVPERMEGLQIAANMNIQIAFYLPDNLLPNGSIFHISTNVLAVNWGVRNVALSRRNIRLWVFCFLAAAAYRFSRVQLCATLWTAACHVPLSLGFSRQEYWSGLPCSPPWYLPDPGIELTSLCPELQADSLLLNFWESPVDTQALS